MSSDHVEQLIEQWERERPDLDVTPMAIIGRVSRLSRILERKIEEVYARHGLNQAQFGVLAALRRAGSPYCLSPTALYNSLLISSGAMTNRLERLKAAGLVERIPDEADRRSMLVALTPAGKRLTDAVLTEHYANEKRLLAALPAGEQARLAKALQCLLLHFDDSTPPHAATNPRRVDGATARSSRRPLAGAGPSRTRPQATRER